MGMEGAGEPGTRREEKAGKRDWGSGRETGERIGERKRGVLSSHFCRVFGGVKLAGAASARARSGSGVPRSAPRR